MSECLEGTTERVKERMSKTKSKPACPDCAELTGRIAYLESETRKLIEVIKLLLDTPLPGKALKIAERGLADADSQSVE